MVSFNEYKNSNTQLAKNDFFYQQILIDQLEILTTLQRDYEKWKGLVKLDVVKDSDTKPLAKTIYENYNLFNDTQIMMLQNDRFQHRYQKESIKFFIHDTLIHLLDVLFIKFVEVQTNAINATMAFESCFPKEAFGDPLWFHFIMFNLVSLITESNAKEN